MVFQYRNPSAPWLTANSINLLEQIVKKSDVCVEFGSGRSSIWLAERCAELTSIEHDKAYFGLVSKQLAHLQNANVIFRSIDDGKSERSDYASTIEKLNDNSIDLVLNDGKCRDQIALSAVKKLRKGGVLVIDNAERYLANKFDVPESQGPEAGKMSKKWCEFASRVEDWRRIWVSDGVSTTLILFKS